MSRCIFFIWTLAFVLSVNVSTVFSETNSKDEAIKELIQVMNTMENMESSLSTMKDTIKMNSPYFLKEVKVILAREMKDEDVAAAAEKFNKDDFGADRLYQLFRYKFNLTRVEEEIMLPVYREHYDEAEIRQLISFYTSDLGQKTLKLNPTISREISTKTRDMSQMALNQAKEELAFELQKELDK